MFRLVVLCAIFVASGTGASAVFGSRSNTEQNRVLHESNVANPSGYYTKRSTPSFRALEPFFQNPPHRISTQIAYVNEIKKRSISFVPPKNYAPATPYAPSFYAPPTIHFTLSSPYLPKGPFVSAYTPPAHYIQKRLSYIAIPLATHSSSLPGLSVSGYPVSDYVIQKREIQDPEKSY